jgi:hypothetical protein
MRGVVRGSSSQRRGVSIHKVKSIIQFVERKPAPLPYADLGYGIAVGLNRLLR